MSFRDYIATRRVTIHPLGISSGMLERTAICLIPLRHCARVEALQVPRGVQPINAATIIVELGNLRRFDNPRN